MFIQRVTKDEKVIESYTISSVTNADMRKMTQVYDRVMGVIENHLNKSAEKKEYLSDDDLYDIVAILDVLTEGNRTTIRKSEFDERKELIIKNHKELLNAPAPVKEDMPEVAI